MHGEHDNDELEAIVVAVALPVSRVIVRAPCLGPQGELTDEIANDAADATAAREVRELEKSDFQAANKDYSESLDALSRAIQLLKSQSVTNAAAETFFMQLKTATYSGFFFTS